MVRAQAADMTVGDTITGRSGCTMDNAAHAINGIAPAYASMVVRSAIANLRAVSVSSAAFRAIFNVLPDGAPFLAPDKRPGAGRANLGIELSFSHGPLCIDQRSIRKAAPTVSGRVSFGSPKSKWELIRRSAPTAPSAGVGSPEGFPFRAQARQTVLISENISAVLGGFPLNRFVFACTMTVRLVFQTPRFPFHPASLALCFLSSSAVSSSCFGRCLPSLSLSTNGRCHGFPSRAKQKVTWNKEDIGDNFLGH